MTSSADASRVPEDRVVFRQALNRLESIVSLDTILMSMDRLRKKRNSYNHVVLYAFYCSKCLVLDFRLTYVLLSMYPIL